MSPQQSALLLVRESLVDSLALDPSAGTRLADLVIERHKTTPIVILDFSGVGTVTSGFANALAIQLAGAAPLDRWKLHLRFVGLAPRQADVIAKSLRAARKLEAS